MEARQRNWGSHLRRLGFALSGLLMLCGGSPRSMPNAAYPVRGYDVRSVPLDRIAPGTVIGNQAPPGWSHLMAKVHSRVGAGDVNRISETVAHLASFLFSSLVADVQAVQGTAPPRYRLNGIAVGIGMRIRGQDVIISSATQRSLGGNLDLLHQTGLRRAEARLQQVRWVARGETFAIFDSPTRVVRDGRHRAGIVRHAVLVDGQTGRMATLIWLILQDEKGAYVPVADALELLPMPRIEETVLHIDAREFVLGVITEDAIALNEAPRGVMRYPIPAHLAALVHQERISAESAALVEGGLRRLLVPATP